MKSPGTAPCRLRDSAAPATPGGFALSIVDCYQNPLFVVLESGHLVYCNRAGGAVLSAKAGFVVRNGRLQFASKPADAALQRILTAPASVSDARTNCYGVRCPRSNESRDWFVLVRGLEAPDGDARVERMFLLHAIARLKPRSLPSQVLQDLFGLTERETTVVAELLRSGAVRAAAHRLSLSTETVRSHLKRTFQKCDVHSRAELLALLQGVADFACD